MELILAQPHVGTTVKCDGEESDPFAFISVLNLRAHREKDAVKQLMNYRLKRTAGKKGFENVKSLLHGGSDANVGLILTERFINMPHQIVPPLYRMLAEESAAAASEGQTFTFTHFIILSKTYLEVASALDDATQPKKKKSKNESNGAALETFFFHPEDAALARHASGVCNFDYENAGHAGASDARRAFQDAGIKPQGHVLLFERSKIEDAIAEVEKYLGAESET